jgi:hypothetical protein
MLAASIAPSAAPAPTRVCSSSMKRMASLVLRSSSMIFLRRSSNSPRYLVPATSQSFCDGRLADAGLADQGRVVLRPAAQDLDDPLDLLLAADDRIELAQARGLREVDAQLVDGRRLAGALGLLSRAGRG